MTIQTLINKVQEEKPNTFSNEKLLSFINEIESDVAEQVNMDQRVYSDDDTDVELMVPAPYDRLYVSYVKAMIDYSNEEYPSYQLNASQHMQDFRDFLDWVVRTGQIAENPMPRRFAHAMQ